MNHSIQKIIFICTVIIISPALYAVWFENKYLVPDLCPTPMVTYRRACSYITVQPFVINGDSAYGSCAGQSQDKAFGIYELGGQLTLNSLDQALMTAGITNQSLLPTAWLASRAQIPIRLGGRVDAAGLAWNVAYAFNEHFTAGWACAGYKVRGMLQIDPPVSGQTAETKEAELHQILSTYAALTNALGLTTSFYTRSTIADSDLYIRYEYFKDYCLRLNRIKGMIQLGTLAPSAHGDNPYCAAAIPLGSDKHWALYGALEVDCVLKEDIILSFAGRAQYNVPKTLIKRVPIAAEPVQYGVLTANVHIKPGWTGYFSPALTVEGIREGLGCKLAYSIVAHGKDSWNVLSYVPTLPPDVFPNVNTPEAYSSWGQEHFLVSVFYDFSREDYIDRPFEPFIGFSAQIPVDWWISKNSARSYALSCIIETLY